MPIIAYNQTTGSLLFSQLSLPNAILPASGSGGVDLTDTNEVWEIQADDELYNYITASLVVLDIGKGILDSTASLRILENVSSSINTATNIGAGEGIFANKTNVTLQFRSITATGSVSIVSGSSTLNISSSAVMSASNTGSGIGTFDRRENVDLVFRSLSGSGGIAVYPVSGNIIVSGSSNITNVTTNLKEPVKYATTGVVGLYGTSSVDFSGSDSSIYPVLVGDRILVKNQLTASQNGVYIAATGSWVRADDYDSGDELTDGTMTWVVNGYRQRSSQWVLTTPGTSSVVVDTTPLRFTQNASIENTDIIPFPESRTGGNSTRTAQQSYEGGSYFLVQPARISKVAVRLTSISNNPNLVMLFFQAPNGNSGLARRVATITASVVTANEGVNIFSFQEGEVLFEQGIFYILWGKITQSPNNVTMRTYVVQNLDLIVTTMPAGVHRTVFTTNISTTGSYPNIFDAATQTNEVITDVIPIVRFLNF